MGRGPLRAGSEPIDSRPQVEVPIEFAVDNSEVLESPTLKTTGNGALTCHILASPLRKPLRNDNNPFHIILFLAYQKNVSLLDSSLELVSSKL